MSASDSILTRALDDAFERLGESATYTPADSSVQPFACLMGPPKEVGLDAIIERQVHGDMCERDIRHSDLSKGGICEPTLWMERKRGDTVTIKSPGGRDEEWKVVERSYQPPGLWSLTLQKNIRIVPS